MNTSVPARSPGAGSTATSLPWALAASATYLTKSSRDILRGPVTAPTERSETKAETLASNVAGSSSAEQQLMRWGMLQKVKGLGMGLDRILLDQMPIFFLTSPSNMKAIM